MELKSRCILDFFRAAVFFLIMPFWAAVSIFFIISFRAASASPTPAGLRPDFWAKTTNFFALVLTEVLTALFLILRSSLCRCRFSADECFLAKKTPNIVSLNYYNPLKINGDTACKRRRKAISYTSYLNSDGRRSVRLHFSHSARFFTLPFSKTVFILTSPPHEQKNFCVALVVREFLLACPITCSLPQKNTTNQISVSIVSFRKPAC